jgi:hypothetical protein
MPSGSDFLLSGNTSDKLFQLLNATRQSKREQAERAAEERKKAEREYEARKTRSQLAGAASMGISGAMLGGSLGGGAPGAIIGGLAGAGIGALLGDQAAPVAGGALQAGQLYKQHQPVKPVSPQLMLQPTQTQMALEQQQPTWYDKYINDDPYDPHFGAWDAYRRTGGV